MLDMEYDPQALVKGGSEHNTDKKIVESMRSMYDSTLNPILQPKKSAAKAKIDSDKDPVCGMVLTGYANTVHNKGTIISFCSGRCINGFKKVRLFMSCILIDYNPLDTCWFKIEIK